jgi:hypothetical protein
MVSLARNTTVFPAGTGSCYVINLYTWLKDLDSAAELARRVCDLVVGFRDIDELATTLSEEENPAGEPVRLYADIVNDVTS